MLESLQQTFLAGFNIRQLAKPWQRAKVSRKKKNFGKKKKTKGGSLIVCTGTKA